MALYWLSSARNTNEKKKSQLTSCYWWISLLTHPNHSSPGTVTSNTSFSAFQLSSSSGPVLVNSPKARIAGKGTSLTMQSLTCFSQEILASTNTPIPLTAQSFCTGISEMSKLPRLNWRKTVWSEFKETTQNKLLCLLYWSISSCIISTHRYDELNSCLCNQTHYCIASSVTEQNRSKLVLMLHKITCWDDLLTCSFFE